ncbi:cytochrome P450 3A24-like [Oppia nitens]|uniref:cytochrome P450 3A24-like n=1 Tax=Oppia nitens TaxID=1686743 RepID=UPI0023DA9DE7|nr:cytochrome P450 3A24-like [Oppia nitens]
MCLYETIQICQIYFSYKTTTFVDYDNIEEISLPAFTICFHKRDLLRQQYLTNVSNNGNQKQSNDYNEKLDQLFINLTIRQQFQLLQNWSDIVDNCNIYKPQQLINTIINNNNTTNSYHNTQLNRVDCHQISKIRQSIDFSRSCFTLFSQSPNQTINDKQFIVDNDMAFNDLAQSLFYIKLKDHFKGSTITLIAHPRRQLMMNYLRHEFTDISFQRISRNRTFVRHITYERTIVQSLKLPYETDCYDYKDQGYESRSQCIDYCRIDEAHRLFPGVWPGNYLTYNQTSDEIIHDLINEFMKNFSLDQMMGENCRQKCGLHSECTQEYYRIHILHKDFDVDGMYVPVLAPVVPDLVYTHSAKILVEEFLSYIGSYVNLCYLTRNFNYWTSRGINGPKPVPGLGTLWQIFYKPIGEINLDNYKKYGKIYGVFMVNRPVLTVADPDLIKQMNIRDFHMFVDRNDLITGDPMNDRSMFNLKGDEWKKIRSIISPTFSSGKMRSMHPLIIDCIARLDKHLSDKTVVEMQKTMGNLTMDVIATCAFGTRIDTYAEKTSDFVIHAQKVFRGNWRVWFTLILLLISKRLANWFGIKFLDPGAENFFKTAIQSIVSRRKVEGNSKIYKDYIQLMINAQNKTLMDTIDDQEVDDLDRVIFGSTDSSLKYKDLRGEITDWDVLATSFVFFVAGYETTATTLAHLFYSLAVNQDCQQKLYDEVTKQFDGKYDYESIARMTYLESCVAETLRLYSPLTATARIAADEYTIGDTGLTIPKGMLVNFDIQTLHNNPEYYPDPDRWNPERFMPYNRHKLVPYTYMPFGLGPRNCVGMRFALMETKTAVAYLITKYKFVKTPNTTIPLKPKKFEFLLNTGDKFVGIEHRN